MEEAAEDRPKKRLSLSIRQMEIDDIAEVFHLGEELFTASEWPTLYRTWDEYEVITLFQSDPELCLVAELATSWWASPWVPPSRKAIRPGSTATWSGWGCGRGYSAMAWPPVCSAPCASC
ncbi:MAG: hypothetical protein V1797_12115 [Pseudomonadota bacterium]